MDRQPALEDICAAAFSARPCDPIRSLSLLRVAASKLVVAVLYSFVAKMPEWGKSDAEKWLDGDENASSSRTASYDVDSQSQLDGSTWTMKRRVAMWLAKDEEKRLMKLRIAMWIAKESAVSHEGGGPVGR